MLFFSQILNAQHLGSARGVGLAAFTSIANDITAIDWNPAGLTNIKEWEIDASNFISTKDKAGFSLHSLGVAKKISDHHFGALSYSPGKVLEFVVPTMLNIFDSSGNNITTKFGRQVSYRQSYALGYGYRLVDAFSLGVSARLFESKISDTKYFFDTNYAIQSQILDYTSSVWTMDVGASYNLDDIWSFSIVLKNIIKFSGENFPADLSEHQLNLACVLRLGASYSGFNNFILSADGDSKKNFQLGMEWSPSQILRVRSGIYSNDISQSSSDAAVAAGIGIIYKPVKFDLSYLHFFSTTNRTGSININTFKSVSFTDLDYTPFTSDRITFSVSMSLGKTKESLAKIEYVEMTKEIFTASPKLYAFQPIGKARVRNISPKTINAKVSFYISDLMNQPTETKPYTVAPDELTEIPFYAVLDERADSVKKYSIYDGTIYVQAETVPEYDDSYQTRVLVRGRNEWDGDARTLKYFVTPENSEVIKFTRQSLNSYSVHLDTIPSLLQNFERAKIIFNQLSKDIQYVSDPKLSKDHVQYPAETLSLHTGDCDDLAVYYSSMLMSIGIPTAFIDVVPPDTFQDAHIYIMFDTGIDAKNASHLSENPKRYVIRKNEKGNETAWLPIETTLIPRGFEAAWSNGAEEYFNDSEINLGILKGWMRIIDLEISN